MKTYSQKSADVSRQWFVIDASEAPLGRIATKAASLLLGKGKPTVTSHTDGGDFVIIINSDNLVVTGRKLEDKTYYRHSGYPGGLYQRTLTEQLKLDSTAVLQMAISGMLPTNKLKDGRLKRLKIYPTEAHNHAPQQPKTISMKGKN